MMKLRVLGCSGGIGGDLRTTSLLIDDDILIDAGTGVGELSAEEMRRIRHVFLTHTHLDHIACLPLMIDSLFPHLTESLVIHAQEESIEVLKKHIFNWAIWPDFAALPSRDQAVMRYQAHRPGELVDIGGRCFEMIAVNHIVPTVGYRIRGASGGVAAFSGDTTSNDNFWNVLNAGDRLDLLLAEVAFSERFRELSLKSKHYCPSLLAQDLTKLRHHPRVYLTHHKPGDEALIFEQCRERIAGHDLHDLTGGAVLEV
jgi:ribonuclease BN (tRNA processing enzyme)